MKRVLFLVLIFSSIVFAKERMLINIINNVSIPVICDDVICFFNKNFRVATQITQHLPAARPEALQHVNPVGGKRTHAFVDIERIEGQQNHGKDEEDSRLGVLEPEDRQQHL